MWFLQCSKFELGDFVMMTSGLKAISELMENKVNVFFETQVVKDLYLDCPFINILYKKHNNKPFESTKFSSWKHGGYRKKRINNEESMQKCFWRIFAKEKGYQQEMPHTYVDSPKNIILDKTKGKKYIAVMQGCLGDGLVNKKGIPMSSLQFLINNILLSGYIPVLLGSKGDVIKYWNNIKLKNNNIVNYLGKLSIRDSISILSQCDSFIANDTGLYHVACAYKMEGMVLWNRTEFFKNAPAHNKVIVVHGKDKSESFFNDAIINYLRGLL